MKRVVIFGVFDILHPGHLYFLRQAKKRGTHLTVVVTRDARAADEKKRKPILHERKRLKMVRALGIADRVMLGDRVGQWRLLKRLRPDVVCVGYDQKMEWIERCGLKKMPKVVRIKGWRANKYGSRLFQV